MKRSNFFDDSILKHRRIIVFIVQTLLVPCSYFAAFLLRFDFNIDQEMVVEPFLKTVPLLLLSRIIFFYYFDLFSGWWRYVGIEDFIKIVNSIIFSSLLFIALVVFFFGLEGFPRSVFLIDTILIAVILCGIRVLAKTVREKFEIKKFEGSAKKIFIMGAGNTGIAVLNEIKNSFSKLHYKPLGFLDDDPLKKGSKIRNLKVLGTHYDIPELITRYDIDEILIAVPSASYKTLLEIFKICDTSNVEYKTLPGISKIISGKTFVSQMRDVAPDMLLGRPTVSFVDEKSRLQKDIFHNCVLVTGAGGSIGSELCRQIAKFRPETLIMYERNEENLYYIDIEISKKFPHINVVSIIGDILNKEKFEHILETYMPDVIYHAAAYKHVPLMEKEPVEAIRNNLIGTKGISDLCVKLGIKKFIFISTDKAVNPSSVMGTTKRMTEKLLQTYGTKPTKFMSVRFGNVIGSSGSVIPLFKKQIAEGGPVTVTHPDTTRFLMTIPEAVHLVLLAGSMGTGAEIYLLEMGTPANIADLAKSLIELSGLTPDKDIAIEYIGLRDGEKLHEELYWEGEDIVPTAHNKIRELTHTSFNYLNYKIQVSKIERILGREIENEKNIYELLKNMVPESTCTPQQNKRNPHPA